MIPFLLFAATVAEPDIVVRAPRIAPKPTRSVQCENPLAEWKPMVRRSRSVPMGHGRMMRHSQITGGFFIYHCTADAKSAFALLTPAQRAAVEGRLRAIEAARLVEEQEWDAKEDAAWGRWRAESNRGRKLYYAMKRRARDQERWATR